jgi:ribosomal protein S20
MPIIKSAVKRMKQDKGRYAKNLRVKRDLRTATKSFVAKPTFDGLKDVQSKIDTAVKKNILKKNTAARKMSQMSKIAKDAGVKIASGAKKTAAKPATKPAVAKKTTAVAKKPAATKTAAKKAPAKKPAAKKAA